MGQNVSQEQQRVIELTQQHAREDLAAVYAISEHDKNYGGVSGVLFDINKVPITNRLIIVGTMYSIIFLLK